MSDERTGEHIATGIAGPVACDTGVQFVKGHFRRPFRVGDLAMSEGGGRVTELTARPLLRLFYPELAEVRQPLAGEVLGAVAVRLEREGRLVPGAAPVRIIERPPLAAVRAA